MQRRRGAGAAGLARLRASRGSAPREVVGAALPVVVVQRSGRLCVSDAATGEQIGWRDERTGMVYVDDGADLARVHAGLKAWDTA